MARKYGLGQIYRRGEIWWIDYLHRGARYRESTGSSRKQDASRLLKQRITEIHSGTFVSPTEQRLTVNDLLDALQQDYELGDGKSLPQFLAHMHPVREAFGRIRAADLSETRIDRYIKERLDAGRKPSTVNRETQLLGQAFRLAEARRWVNRVPHIRRLPERNARQGFFEAEEIEAVIAHLPHYLKDFVRFGYLSGWRKGEIASLIWDDVDHDARIIRLRPEGSKTGEGRVLALSGELWNVIEQRRQDRVSTPWVFHRKGLPIGDIRKAWKTACRRAGVPSKLFHDLRRTAVRDMVRAGVPERIAMAISGHTTRSIFDRYNIVSEADLREAVERTHTYRKTKTRLSKGRRG